VAIGFTKFFIKPDFICRGDIRTYNDLLMLDAEFLNTVHSSNIEFLVDKCCFSK